MSGKRYTEEFKIEAVKQVTERGHPATAVAARLGVSAHSFTSGPSVIARHRPNDRRLTTSKSR
jgi:transposase-like protein